MKLAGLQIDRFGARSRLELSNISERLNLVYGPNGSGKTTVIQFIRWMMYGQCDEISRPYLANADGTRGSMTIVDGYGSRTLQRTCQPGSLVGHLVTDTHGAVQSSSTAVVSNTEFDRFFLVSFDSPRELGDLFNAARTHGFQLHLDQRHLDHIRELAEQIDRHRSELSRFGNPGRVDVLRARRDEKQREIDAIRGDWRYRLEQLESRRDQTVNDIASQQTLCDRLRTVVGNIEVAIEGRKQQLEEEHAQWLSARSESDQRRHRQIQEIDAQIVRWQDILAEVRDRLEQVRNRISSYGDVGVSPTEATDLHYFMRRLGFRIRDIEQDLQGVYESDSWRDHESDANYLRGLLGSALNSMQSDVTRLAQTVERQQQTNELQECREELTYLCRVERELADLLEALARQRHSLSRESEFYPSAMRHLRFPSSGHSIDQYSLDEYNELSERPLPDLTSYSVVELANALDDFRLRHLIERRESAVARLSEAELELTNLQRSLRLVEDELARFDVEGRIHSLEREIAELDEQLRQFDIRASIERKIASLEEELRIAREYSGKSEIIEEASTLLARLTGNDYRRISLSDAYHCRVERHDGKVYPHEQLSRGVQDQVYLALSLAIVAAYGRKGTSVPLILNDVFVNLDEAGIHALSDTLLEFTSAGHQTLVFTRHAHIRELFARRSIKTFALSDLDSSITSPVSVAPRPYVPPTPKVELDPPAEDPTYQWVAEWQRRDPVHPTPPAPLIPPKPIPSPEPPPTPPDDVESRRQPVVHLTSALRDVPTLASDLVRLLADLSIHHVEAFLDRDPDELALQLKDNGVTAEMIQRRQRELLMLVYLGVSILDAQLLVACGVPDPARLGRADEAVLLKRVETILERPQATERFGVFSDYSLARIRNWIDAARDCSYRARSRRSYASDLVHRPLNLQGKSRRSSSRAGLAVKSTPPKDRVTLTKDRGLKFYLEMNDPVVDAPSIGPKTAEKLNQIDIYTVSNLLEGDPVKVARQLNDKRIDANTVEKWQLQSQLVCRIPNLRGHDAQILVECGVEEPVTLSAMNATSLLKLVAKFVASKEGQRILRNNKKPDLSEVTAWIEWSGSARELRAA